MISLSLRSMLYDAHFKKQALREIRPILVF